MVTLPLGPVAGCAVGPVPLGEAGPAGAPAGGGARGARGGGGGRRGAGGSLGPGRPGCFRGVGGGFAPRRDLRWGTSPRPTGTRRPTTSHRAGSLGVHDLGLEESGA